MIVSISRENLAVVSLAIWGLFVALVLLDINPVHMTTGIGFVALVFLPGLLTMFALRLDGLEWWGEVAIAVALSLLELMLVGLIGNTILPVFGVTAPLSKPVFLIEFSLLILALTVLVWRRVQAVTFVAKKYVLFDSGRNLVIAVLPSLLVILSALGAVRLNNGGSGIITLVMLILTGAYLSYLLWKNESLEEEVAPLALFFVSLALLLMTSLRGWHLAGHDIQREYQVFELAKNAGIWSIASYHDAYNACISITILPTIFALLAKVYDPYVYKIIFQVLFAVVPGVLYLIIRKYVNATLSLASVIYFIAFPTFFGDMPFLNRQEIAFIFLALMIYIIFTEHVSLVKRRILFVLFGIGMILSHYSTTYTVIALLLFSVVAGPIVNWVGRFMARRGWFPNSSFAPLHTKFQSSMRITGGMISLLIAASFLWSSILTDTSSNSLYRVIQETIAVIQQNSKDEETRSGDVLYSLFSWGGPTFETSIKVYRDYIDKLRADEPKEFYSDYTYDQYPIVLAPATLLPVTSLGRMIENLGVNVYDFNYYFRQTSAKLVQLFVLIGCLGLLFSARYVRRVLPTEFVLLAFGSMCMVLSQVVLPVLSAEYGLLRAFQQSLMFLGLFVVAGSMTMFFFLGKKWSRRMGPILAIVFLLSTTGVFVELLGGYAPQLHLNNGGQYYDLYYIRKNDRQAAEWLATKAARSGESVVFQSQIHTDTFSSTGVKKPNKLEIITDVYPGAIRKSAYVFLDEENVVKGQATINVNGDLITYLYPASFLDEHKDLLYTNGSIQIFK